ncbi:MAG TPA: GSCFA domain-containing protein, partial [Salinimicrobium sp.]|nr:GSCFA domain-containing protein [Salinimicrobium sp.]
LDHFLNSKIAYFPSYEIMMDELRDYRFYAADMIHPSEIAIDYIWERFSEIWIAPEAESIMKTVEKIQNGLQHRAFNLESTQNQQFLQVLEERKLKMQEQFPHISF